MRKLLIFGATMIALVIPSVALAVTGASDSFDRSSSSTLGTSSGGQTWIIENSSHMWGIKNDKYGAFIPQAGQNHLISAALVDANQGPAGVKVKAQLRLSNTGGSANAGLFLDYLNSDNNLFCKFERNDNAEHPRGFISIGKEINGDEASVADGTRDGIGSDKIIGASERLLQLGTWYDVSCQRVGNVITARISGGNLRSPGYSVTYTLQTSPVDEVAALAGADRHGMRIRYVVDLPGSNEDDGQSRWDNFAVCSPVSSC